ncbi:MULTISPECIES: fimbria/pilus outer membrane usher protein [Pseudomonas]|uniref:Type 1 pili usher protein n=1 Tax=Pseudomonas putida NBRC 14164 TaxID=1211579 RepID=A0ABM7EIR5_PSEPU|nr:MULTISPECIES: fimbria/pilus outer membrane usher protein [Pseudomonas]EKT4461404.1 fimbrial biogenesis outer membrane usher protein [Pseudomonas putida]EKT4557569.1 fimbrial biogenesis outer membrane usher protein [Pseudomonas putida]MCX9138008.1 fimbrial biogenesis outer membrane usher protein [Pseudomonas sp. DCB_PUT]MDD1970179.1 fimbrial biogenesis outer membrane usher protein [Pseudomonas putida]MDO1462529.1 fimbrial biogenesis outer membrane usher protein [Pseudomonas putida]
MLQLERRRLLPLRPRLAPLPPLLGGCLALALAHPALAGQTDIAFQPGFMRQAPGQSAEAGTLALQNLAAQALLPSGRYRVQVSLNLSPLPEQDIDFIEGPNGKRLQPCLTAELLRTLDLREQALETPLPDDDSCVDLAQLVPHASADFDPAQLHLSLSIPQIALRQDRSGSVPEARWSNGINAAFISYQASAQHSSQRDGRSRSSQDLYLNSGLNLGPWRLRSKQALREEADGARRWTRSDTFAQRDLPGLQANLTLGETFTNSDMFRSVRFTGAQVASDTGMLPDAMQHYAPIIRGVAQSRAKVEILHNGYPIYSSYVAPGPYAIDDLSVGSGHGELEVVITEADGQIRRFTQPYSSMGSLLREGVWRYSATVGRYDGAEQLDDPMFWQATLARGGVWDTTLYGGVLSSEYYNASVLGMGRDIGQIGALSFDVTRSSSALGTTLGDAQGHSFALRYGKSFQSRTSVRFAGYRYSTEGYRDFDEAVRQRSNASSYLGNRRSRLEASVYQSVGDRSALNLTLSQDTYWQTSHQRRQYQLQYTTRLGKVAVNLFASQALDSKNDDSRMFGLSLSMPLDFGRQQQASFDVRNNNGQISERASLSGGLLDNRLSYSTSLANDDQGRNSGGLSINYQGSQASVGMGYNEGNDYRSMSVNASGAVMLHGDGLAFGSHLGETMALVHVPDVAGVGVQNTSSARTNAQGYALVPYLRPYRLNSLVLQTDDLSPEVVIGNASQQVVPRRGAVVKASYEAEHVGRLVLTLRQANGQPVPFGAQVLDADGQSLGVVGQAGQALVSTRTTGPQTIRVLWGEASDKACTLHIDPQALAQEGGYRLQTLHCQLPVASSQPLLPGDNTQETL